MRDVWEIIDRNPAAAKFRAAKRKRVVRAGGPKIRSLDPDEARKFLEAAEGDRHETLYTLAITTGLRPEELHGLRWKDLDLGNHRLTINQVVSKTRRKKGEDVPRYEFGPPKTDKSRRTIDYPAFVADLFSYEREFVNENRRLAGDRWKEGSLVERNVLRRFQAMCENNSLPKLRLYDLRHTHASLLIHEGVHPKKISERLGHSSIKLTMDTYGHLFEGSDRDSAEKMEKLFVAEPKAPRVLTMPDRSRVADKAADKITEARLVRVFK